MSITIRCHVPNMNLQMCTHLGKEKTEQRLLDEDVDASRGGEGMLCPRHESTRRSAVGRCKKEKDIGKEKPDRRKPKKRR